VPNTCSRRREDRSHSLIPRVRAGLGGSHTVVTSIPLDALRPAMDAAAFAQQLTPVEDLHLYFHIAFCEHICGFCHYAKTHAGISDEGDETKSYMHALTAEIASRRALMEASQVRSLYVGGGTPTVLPPQALAQFLSTVSGLRRSASAPFCVEASPLTLAAPDGREKLQILKALGVTRVSLGVQSFSRALLERHRGHGPELLHDVFAKLDDAGLEVNIDLMQDLPGQTADDLRTDLSWIADLRPSQVTWYILRFDRGSSWDKLRRVRGLPGVATGSQSIARRLQLFDAMDRLGYAAHGGGRFLREACHSDRFKAVRNGLDSTLLGFGVSAYSHGWGHAFRNIHETSARSAARAYVARIERGDDPIETRHVLTDADRIAAHRLVAIRTRLPQACVAGVDPESHRIRTLLAVLADGGIVTLDDGDWRLTRYGRALEEEVASLFYAPDIRKALADAGDYWPANQPGPWRELLALSDREVRDAQVA